METVLSQLSVVAVFVQRAVDFVKSITKYEDYMDESTARKVTIGVSVVLSSALCAAWNVDVFAAAGFPFSLEWVGSLLTGIFASLGSNVINDLIKLLELLRTKKEVELKEELAYNKPAKKKLFDKKL